MSETISSFLYPYVPGTDASREHARTRTRRLTDQEVHYISHVVDAAPQLTCLADIVNANLDVTYIKQRLHRNTACDAHKGLSSFQYIANTGNRAVRFDDSHSGIGGRSVAAL